MPFDDATSADEDTYFTDTAVPAQSTSLPPALSYFAPAASSSGPAVQIPFMSTTGNTAPSQPLYQPLGSSSASNPILRPAPYQSRLPPPPPVFRPLRTPVDMERVSTSASASMKTAPDSAAATTVNKSAVPSVGMPNFQNPVQSPADSSSSSSAAAPELVSKLSPPQHRRLPPPLIPFQPIRRPAGTPTSSGGATVTSGAVPVSSRAAVSAAMPLLSTSSSSIQAIDSPSSLLIPFHTSTQAAATGVNSGVASLHPVPAAVTSSSSSHGTNSPKPSSRADLAESTAASSQAPTHYQDSTAKQQQDETGLNLRASSLFSPQLELHDERQSIPRVATSYSATVAKDVAKQPHSLFTPVQPQSPLHSLVSGTMHVGNYCCDVQQLRL